MHEFILLRLVRDSSKSGNSKDTADRRVDGSKHESYGLGNTTNPPPSDAAWSYTNKPIEGDIAQWPSYFDTLSTAFASKTQPGRHGGLAIGGA
jgi:hypothetical protein